MRSVYDGILPDALTPVVRASGSVPGDSMPKIAGPAGRRPGTPRTPRPGAGCALRRSRKQTARPRPLQLQGLPCLASCLLLLLAAAPAARSDQFEDLVVSALNAGSEQSGAVEKRGMLPERLWCGGRPLAPKPLLHAAASSQFAPTCCSHRLELFV